MKKSEKKRSKSKLATPEKLRPADCGGFAGGHLVVTCLTLLLGAKCADQPLRLCLLVTAVNSIAVFLLYARDKYLAEKGAARITEHDLHMWELLGGWPGGLAGQILLHHKSVKFRYQAVFGGILLLHGALWGWGILHPETVFAVFEKIRRASIFLYSLAGF